MTTTTTTKRKGPLPRFAFRQRVYRETGDLKLRAKIVLTVLVDRTNDETLQCWPKVETIAADAHLTYRTALRGLEELVDAGIVLKRPGRGGPHRREANTYTLNLAWQAPGHVTPVSPDQTPGPLSPVSVDPASVHCHRRHSPLSPVTLSDAIIVLNNGATPCPATAISGESYKNTTMNHTKEEEEASAGGGAAGAPSPERIAELKRERLKMLVAEGYKRPSWASEAEWSVAGGAAS